MQQKVKTNISQTQEFYDQQFSETSYASLSYAEGTIRRLTSFVEEHELQSSLILDVGCGRGWFNELTDQWLGIDISFEAGQYSRGKKFICGDAECLPLAKESVSAVWSITFLEHSPDPESVLTEIDRVLKNGGVLFLAPAWRIPPWRPKGYETQNYNHLNLTGKLVKLILPILNFIWMKGYFRIPLRLLRELRMMISKSATRLAYYQFEPNLEEFLLPDSDARVSLDNHETLLWFLSRGYNQPQKLNFLGRILLKSGPLIVYKNVK